MSKEAMKLALEQRITDYLSAGGLFNPELADHIAVRDLLIDCRKALAKPDFWEGYVPEPVKPAQQEPKIDIYRSFEQWKRGNVLEHGVPRTEHYSEAQLDLVEMGWNYGYDAGRAVEQALDKKAENARELGLDYEPAQQEPVAWRNAALRVGEDLCSVGPFGYYDMTAEQWLDWALSVVTVHAPPAQRTWVGLQDDEIYSVFENLQVMHHRPPTTDSRVIFARAIEAKLKEKNT